MSAVLRRYLPSGCKSRPANRVAPAGSYRSGGGGDEGVGAFLRDAPRRPGCRGGATSKGAALAKTAKPELGGPVCNAWGLLHGVRDSEDGSGGGGRDG